MSCQVVDRILNRTDDLNLAVEDAGELLLSSCCIWVGALWKAALVNSVAFRTRLSKSHARGLDTSRISSMKILHHYIAPRLRNLLSYSCLNGLFVIPILLIACTMFPFCFRN